MVYKAWRAKIQTTQPPDPPRDGTAGSILAVGEEDLHYEKARNLKKSKKKEPRNHRAQFDPRSPI